MIPIMIVDFGEDFRKNPAKKSRIIESQINEPNSRGNYYDEK